MPKIILEEHILNNETEQHTIKRKVFKSVTDNDKYVKLDITNTNKLINKNINLTSLKLFIKIIEKMNYDNEILLNKKTLLDISNEINISVSSLKRYITKLKDIDLIKPTGHRALYLVNPMFAFKQTSSKRKDILDKYFYIENKHFYIK